MKRDADDDLSISPTLTPEQADLTSADPPDPDRTSASGDVDQSVPPHDAALPGYRLERRIGIGGMGEVLLAHDERIGRDVAIKRLRTTAPTPTSLARFLREARIQARLDHPAVVPVHELGTDTTGQPYFTMRRLTGTTLAEHLKATPRPSVQLLLRTFVDVCLAVDFAHARGVVHRDLKPGNVMLGDFGEVYVIDWGVARMVDEQEVLELAGGTGALDGMTEAGVVLGTPGYIAPEQIGNASTVGPAADVYSLAATLFEILAGARLHPRGPDGLISTLRGIDGAPSHRHPELGIPPELDALTVAGLAQDPAERPTARALASAVQAYLDGDRDLERRRGLATAELARARLALASGDVALRADAIRAAGRALALDPESHDAAVLITSLMLEPPRELPPRLAANLAASEDAIQQRQGRVAVRSLVAVLVFLGAAALNGLRSPVVLAGIAAWTGLILVIAWRLSRRAARPGEMWIIAVGNAMLGALLSRLFGPLIIAPVVSCIMAVSLTSYPQLMRHARVVIAMLVAAWLGPVILEYAGVLAHTWSIHEGTVTSTSGVVNVSPTATSILLIGGNVLGIAVIGLFSNALARSRREAQRLVEIQAWHLRQLLPG